MNEIQSKKRGRPAGTKAEITASKLLQIRVEPEQHEAYKQAAETNKQSLSAWVKSILDKASAK